MPEASPHPDVITASSLMSHLYLTPVLVELIRGGVPDHLDEGPQPAADLANRSGLNELSMTRGLRALAGFGAFQEVSPGVFANNSVSDFFRDRPGSFRNPLLFWGSEHVIQSAAALGHSMRTGKASFVHVFGESFWDRMRRLPEENELFNRALAALRGDEHRQIANAYDWSGVQTVVDVGGGAGSLLAAILETNKNTRGILVEQLEVLPDAEHLLSERGIRDRCDFLSGSFFNPIPAQGEVWTISQVLHDWPDADCRSILKNCRKSMRETDRLLVIEMLTVPCKPDPHVSIIDMMMLLYFGEARQRTVDEYSELFRANGLEHTRVLPTAGAFSIVEARPV
jgi:hypothetical protein